MSREPYEAPRLTRIEVPPPPSPRFISGVTLIWSEKTVLVWDPETGEIKARA